MNTEQIQKILAGHTAWLRGAPDCARANFVHANLAGMSLAWTVLAGANLSWAVLAGVNFTGADLTNARFSGADLTDADFTNAVLINASLMGADLTRADFTNAILTGSLGHWGVQRCPPDTDTVEVRQRRALAYRARYPDVPIVAQLDSQILSEIRAHRLTLDMRSWHGDEPDGAHVVDFCGTTHCQAGSAIHLAGAAGYALERQCGSAAIAGRRIYLVSTGRVPDFCADDEVALADIERHATEEAP